MLRSRPRGLSPLLRAAALAAALAALACQPSGGEIGSDAFRFESPLYRQLSLVGQVDVSLAWSPLGAVQSFALRLDGQPVDPGQITVGADAATTSFADPGAGVHVLEADLVVRFLLFNITYFARTEFELVDLELASECELLNAAHCLLPYPSSRFLQEDLSLPSGLSLRFPAAGMPSQGGLDGSPPEPVNAAQFEKIDGFSPTVQMLMHFPQGVDLAASGAPVLQTDTRSPDARSLDDDSPTVLIDAETGERLLHFTELDVNATTIGGGPDLARQALFLRPGRSLVPGRRYIVAVRNLVSPTGEAVVAEPAFAVLRDRRPTTIAALEQRRDVFEDVFDRLAAAGVARDALVLAWDFTTQSEAGLTGQMLSMRDQAFAWLDAQIDAGAVTFTVDEVIENESCLEEDALYVREVRGTYQVPLFLTEDPELDDPTAFPQVLTLGTLQTVGNQPVQNGLTNPPFTIGVPCRATDPEVTDVVFRPILLGHGLFGTGRGFVRQLRELPELAAKLAEQGLPLDDFDYIPGATDWRGLSQREIQGPAPFGPVLSWAATQVLGNLDQFDLLPDRLRQGQLNALVLARMMHRGAFNADPAFQLDGEGIFPGEEDEMYYFGASLGGIMGLMFAALTPDVERVAVDVPGMNFSFLLQRATPFLLFEQLFALTAINDPIDIAVGLSLTHELWVRAEPAGYIRHVTSDPFPDTPAKRILMTEAFLDQQVSNQATEVAARTLGLPTLVGTVRPGTAIPEMDHLAGPLDSAYVSYDTGYLRFDVPEHAPFIPPLANDQATPSNCDPHGVRAFTPASLQQLIGFLQPGGQIRNFCDGVCDTVDGAGDFLPLESPSGDPAPEECKAQGL